MNPTVKACELSLLSGQFAVSRLAPDAAIPAWATQSPFFSITRTSDELSIVCAAGAVPAGIKSDAAWRALRVHGPFALSETGVLAALATPLANGKIPLFVISTFDTDYLLLHAEQLRPAMETLESAGHKIHET